MEQQTHSQITAETICDAIGRKVIAEKIGTSLSAVSNASVAKRFPARWYPGIRELCADAGISCPDEAFNFILPAQAGEVAQ
jgi:hypothetical protein